MKVICVKPLGETCCISGNPAPRPEVGDIDIVTVRVKRIGRKWYKLERFAQHWCYEVENFAILPDTSADEMSEAEKEGIVNLEIV